MSQPQNDMSAKYFEQPDLQNRIEPILKTIEKNTDFKVSKLLQKSAWWTSSSIGAMHYLGKFKGQPAVLKIQGVKPDTSEITNIKAFGAQSQSQLIRPPKIYDSLPWNEKLGFEALIMEKLGKDKLVDLPADENEIKKFFKAFTDYRANCRKQPWLTKPEESLAEAVADNFKKWRKIAQELHPDHPLRQVDDEQLIDQAIEVLVAGYQNVDFEFQHGHFSARDLYVVDKQYVLVSNLYWGWRAPYYDAVFAQHWYQFDLLETRPTVEQLNEHRQWWQQATKKAVSPNNNEQQHLLKLAFLERAAAGLNLDGLVGLTPASQWLINTLRAEIKQLISQLS
jgi:hypothetical protein